LTPRIVSGLLQAADIGMPTTDWLLLGKSGAAAAMREHGLPLLMVRNTQRLRIPEITVVHAPPVFRFDPEPPDFNALVNARRPAEDSLPALSAQLVAMLENAT
jgi:hypothetical protein